jgi:uncharacterized protein YbaA (DUF1428 family)
MREISFKESGGVEGNHVQQFIYRVPKKNYEAVMDFQKQLNDVFKKHGVTNRVYAGEVENVPGFVNIFDVGVSANQNEEVLMVITFYKDRKHRDDVVQKILNDENYMPVIKEYVKLLTPESSIVVGEFDRLYRVHFVFSTNPSLNLYVYQQT